MTTFSQGKYALAISDRSGMAFPYNEMVREWNGAFVHISEFEPKQPQLDPKPTSADPQALQRARPARTEFPTEDFLPDNPITTAAADATVSIAFENGAMQVNDFVRLRNIKSPVGGVAIATLQLSTTLTSDITATADTIVLDVASIFPTSGFVVIENNLPKNIQITHKSLFDNTIEGIKLKNKHIFSVQYHPEANPGPQDSQYLFNNFIKDVKKYAKKKRY